MLAKNPHMRIRQCQQKLSPGGRCFSHEEACQIAGRALLAEARMVVIDLASMDEATTSAFAQLILLRRRLLSLGRDLKLTGLRDRTAGMFEVNRLAAVLPVG